MSKQYDNNLSGALFRNDDKRPDKQDPDYRGNAEVDRKQFWIDAWINESRDGKRYMKLKFRPKLAAEQSAVPHKEPAKAEDFDDDIPF